MYIECVLLRYRRTDRQLGGDRTQIAVGSIGIEERKLAERGIGSWNGCAQEALPLKGGGKTPMSAQGKPGYRLELAIPGFSPNNRFRISPYHDAITRGPQAVRKTNSGTPRVVSAPRYEPIDTRLHNVCRHGKVQFSGATYPARLPVGGGFGLINEGLYLSLGRSLRLVNGGNHSQRRPRFNVTWS